MTRTFLFSRSLPLLSSHSRRLTCSGIKQYLCQTCNYNGVTQSDLNRHCKTRSHVLRSANVCPLCSLGFSTRILLQDHLDKFHESSPFDGSPPPSSHHHPPSAVSAAACDLSVKSSLLRRGLMAAEEELLDDDEDDEDEEVEEEEDDNSITA